MRVPRKLLRDDTNYGGLALSRKPVDASGPRGDGERDITPARAGHAPFDVARMWLFTP